MRTWRHRHPVNIALHDHASPGQLLADRMAAVIGSWPFLVTQTLVLAAWVCGNLVFATHAWLVHAWDPMPFILLNLCLSFQAAYTGPILLIAGNRQSQKDRLTLEHAASEADKADQQNEEIARVLQQNTTLTEAIHALVTAQGVALPRALRAVAAADPKAAESITAEWPELETHSAEEASDR